jgi:hypothetical protein
MHYQILKNFVTLKIRQDDIFIPSMILFLIRNGGKGDTKEIAKLIYIFDYKHDIEHYEKIVENFSAVILEDYNLIYKEDNLYKLRTWPLNSDEIDNISLLCSKVSNGFFKNLQKSKALS